MSYGIYFDVGAPAAALRQGLHTGLVKRPVQVFPGSLLLDICVLVGAGSRQRLVVAEAGRTKGGFGASVRIATDR